MKQVFFDKNQLVVIKVFPSSKTIEREICGAKNLSKAVLVPKIEQLDTKVAKISLFSGFLGYQINEKDLNSLVAKFLLKKKPIDSKIKFTILGELDDLRKCFKGNLKFIRDLDEIETEIRKSVFYPVHGDLQKQNMMILEGKLGLIDFEHFIIAPKELEICNSLFFSDGNCLDVKNIARSLPRGFINKKTLNLMIKFYKLKQISLGMDLVEAEIRFQLACDRIEDEV